jgi:hypothetical protein
MKRGLIIAAALLLAATAVACREDGEERTGELPVREQQTQLQNQPQPRTEADGRQVTIYNDRVEPRQITFQTGIPLQVQVNNQSSRDCSFYVGEFAKDTQIAAGQTGAMTFTVPAPATQGPQVGTQGVTGAMGCAGDSEREGRFVAEFRGVGTTSTR